MNIHEYQAKALLEKFSVPVPRGQAVSKGEEIEAVVGQFSEGPLVVKAQIHAGGRGKGTFSDGFRGGVKLVGSRSEAIDVARRMLGNNLVTHQTGPSGRVVGTVYFTEACDIAKEYYLAVLLDRSVGLPVVIASTEGGVDIETVAAESPEKIHRIHVDPAIGLQAHQARSLGFALGLSGDSWKQFVRLLPCLYRMYWELDTSLVEINPLVLTKSGSVLALDAKVTFDDNAISRHPEILALRDLGEEDPKEVEASREGLSYIALDGDIACLVNGAGLAMATMDIIKHYGGNPANFLDVGGGASKEQVTSAFRIILRDPNVKGILVNIFGGIMDCDTIAHGIIAAAQELGMHLPLVVRLEGNNVAAGKQTLSGSGLSIASADSLDEAARRIVELVSSSSPA